jgi:UDP-N-acetylmuramoyl-tripeptide--D-alanyl-D-alanine ligase
VGAFALTAAEAAAAARGRVVQGDPATRLDRITIDSRTAARGEFFVAIKGERFDGHAFVADALARGVAGVMVHEAIEPPQGAGAAPVVIRVEETTRALQDVAHEVRRRSGAQVVAITGSAGKTTTKDVAAEFLSTRYRVFKNKGNLNNHIGLPLSLLELRSGPELAVVELGMNHPGEIRTLVGIAAPDVRVWTNVGDAHLGFFESPDAIAQAKAEILEHADANDLLVANANDPRVMTRAEWFVGRVRTFGIDVPADVAATMVEHRGLDGTTARLRTREGETQLTTPLLGLGNLSNVLAAATVAIHFDIPVSEIVDAPRGTAAAARGPDARRRLLQLESGGAEAGAGDDRLGERLCAARRRAGRDAGARGPRRPPPRGVGPRRGRGESRPADHRGRRRGTRAG